MTTPDAAASERDLRVTRLIAVLGAAVPGSRVEPIGSIGAGTADAVSDIDLRWELGAAAKEDVDRIGAVLARVGAVESLRWDPETAGSPERRLVFVRFAGWPLYQRVDLELAGSFGTTAAPSAWSAEESALMNAIAVAKALHRGRGDVDGLLARGLERVGAADPGGSTRDRALAIVEAAERRSDAVSGLARRIRTELFG